MNPLQDSFSYLVGTAVDIYMLLVLLRFLFQWLRVDFRNPLVTPIVKLTQPPLALLRRFVPGLFGIDLSAVVLLIALGLVKFYALSFLGGGALTLSGALVAVIANILNVTIWVFIVAIFAQAIMSWFSMHPQHPVAHLLDDITRPVLSPIRRVLPVAGGLDFSSIVALVGLTFLRKLLVNPMLYYAMSLM